jgi:hypothetical protein
MVMSERILFEERQKFGSPSLNISMGALNMGVMGIFGYGLYQQLILGVAFGNNPMSDFGLILTSFLVLLILVFSGLLLYSSNLHVNVTRSGIQYRFWPYFKKVKQILPHEISKYEIRKYKPIREYGGWGVKKGRQSSDMAYNVHGNIGLQLELKDGRRILLGTQRQDALLHAIKKMMESKDE